MPTPTKPAAPSAKPAVPAAKKTYPTVTVLGRLGGDPEVKTVGEKFVCEFSLAEDIFTGEKDAKGNSVKQTVWYKVAAWNGLSDRAQNLTKGQEVVVRGGLKVTPGKKEGKEFRDLTAFVIRVCGPLPEPAGEEELPS